MKKVIALVLMMMAISGCTDTTRSKWAAYGSPHEVQCWNYHQEIYHGVSTGRIQSDAHGMSFEDNQTHELVEILLGQSSTCVIKVKP